MARAARCFFILAFVSASFIAKASPPGVQHWKDSGVSVLFAETKRSPILDIALSFAAGSAYDPPGRSGLASLVSSVLSMGSRDEDELQIADKFSSLGALYHTTVDSDRAIIYLRTLSDPDSVRDAINVVEDFLTHPSFLPSIVERHKGIMLSKLKTDKSFPEFYVKRSLYRQVYGNHPYGVMPTEKSISDISVKDVEDFYNKHYRRRFLSIAMVGNVSRSAAENIVKLLLSGLPSGGSKCRLRQVKARMASEEKVDFLSHQTHIAMGGLAVSYADADYFPLLVANQAFGGDPLTSRLAINIRQNKGLAYSVRSYVLPYQRKGLFGISLQTRASEAAKAVQAVNDELNNTITNCFTNLEIDSAKEQLIRSFPLYWDDNIGYLHILSLIGFYQLSYNWIGSYVSHIRAVTRDDVCRAVKLYIKPSLLSTTIVGPAPREEAKESDKEDSMDSLFTEDSGVN
ncbi:MULTISPECIES: M16 family metallopeptidase [Candidatus Ichthyocystis]|uniref:M16 family metallopeptidase n=1 Tax=Candidatus Ichthyocystis TaxID=2929841 RepID=UPI000B8455D8|nr:MULTISPECIES: pitrilysin family protein [Ichthyocystis]